MFSYKIDKIINDDSFVIVSDNVLNKNKTFFIISVKKHISALANIISSNGNKYTLKVFDKNPFKNKNLPYLRYKLNKNDTIKDDLFDKKAMIISPDVKHYDKIKNNFSSMNFMSPDLLISFINGSGNIDKIDFVNFAKSHNISYYYFVFNDGVYIKDAFSLKTIKINKEKINHNSENHSFWNNINDSFRSVNWSFNYDGFDEYYKDMK